MEAEGRLGVNDQRRQPNNPLGSNQMVAVDGGTSSSDGGTGLMIGMCARRDRDCQQVGGVSRSPVSQRHRHGIGSFAKSIVSIDCISTFRLHL
eukprot:scaffold13703_cov193-Alexandrium_tamarense.AAC.2